MSDRSSRRDIVKALAAASIVSLYGKLPNPTIVVAKAIPSDCDSRCRSILLYTAKALPRFVVQKYNRLIAMHSQNR